MTVNLFKALSDETRLRLLRILIDHKLSVNELVHILEMGQSRISRHLRILTEAGLLTSHRDGLWVFYQADSEGGNQDFLKAVTPWLRDIPEAGHDDERTAKLLEEKQSRSRRFFNEIAEDWDILNKEILGDFDLPARVAETMPPNCRLAVDLGCGTGTVMKSMLAHADGVIGVDQSSGMLEACRKAFAGLPDADKVSLRIGEMEHLPLRDQEADFASVNLVLHHLNRPEAALQEIRRILSPAGRLFISDFEKHNDEYMRERYGDLWLGFDSMQLAVMLRAAGFSRTTIRKQKVDRGLTLILITSYVSTPATRGV